MRPSVCRRETVRTAECRRARELHRHTCRPAAPAPQQSRGSSRTWSHRARCHLPRRDPGALRAGRPHRAGGREAGPTARRSLRAHPRTQRHTGAPPRRAGAHPRRRFRVSIVAAVLAIAAVVYLVVALVRPEKF
ncbi:MAG: potassium-transporting ATPase subunit F [Microbacterium sp.]|nr:potassium-transporting ATPase subunit F [Microbacterium sp.]